MKNSPRPIYPPYIVAALTLIVFVAFGAYNASQCKGKWVFALDDPYIHLAMARNLTQHGVWGAAPGEFSATSSAPLYTLILAGAFMTGLGSEAWLWILSGLGGVVAAFLLTRRVGSFVSSTSIACSLGIACCIGTWLPETMATGMEHTLHMSAVLIVLAILEKVLSSEDSGRTQLWLAASVFVSAGLRYETVFLLPPICWLLWQSGRKQTALTVLICGVFPAIVLGIVYSTNGAMFLPNSVLLKGVDIESGVIGHIARMFRQLDEPSRLTLLVIAVLQIVDIARRKERLSLATAAPSIVFVGALVAHAALARPDRRYLGYILALGIWAAIPALCRWFSVAHQWLRESHGSAQNRALRLVIAALPVITLLPFTEQILDLGRLPRLGQDIYSQQIQTARFLSTYYENQCVGLNDIGTTAWTGKNPILDFWGLASDEVARLRLDGEYGPSEMEKLARDHDVQVVAIYSHWFLRGNGIPESWQLAGRWQIPAEFQVNVASNTVDFFATSAEALEPLRRNLQAFSTQLPPNVKVTL